MIALYDHIQELWAELRGCYMTRRERANVQAELARAVAEQAELDRAFDSALEALQKEAEAIGPPRERPFPRPAGVAGSAAHGASGFRRDLTTAPIRRKPMT